MIFGALLSFLVLGSFVAADQNTIIKINGISVTNNPNDYFDEMSTDITQTDKSSKITAKMPVKKDLPDTMSIKLVIKLDGQDPFEKDLDLCETMEDETIGKSFVNAGTPKDDFPKECPFIAGDWTVVEWEPPKDGVPSGMEGPFTGSMMFYEEGQDPYVVLAFEGELSTAPPEY